MWKVADIIAEAECFERETEAAVRKTSGFLSELHREIQEEKKVAELLGEDFCSPEKLTGKCRRISFELNKCWAKVIGSADRFGDYLPAEAGPEDAVGTQFSRVFSDSNMLFARTGMLPGRLSYERRTAPGIQMNSYNRMLGDDLTEPVRNFALKHRQFMSEFTEVSVDFLFIYGTEDLHGHLDSDAHDIKKTLDNICRFFPHGDSSEYCSVTMRTAVSHKIPEGTYITAIPDLESKISRGAVIETWERHLEAEEQQPECR